MAALYVAQTGAHAQCAKALVERRANSPDATPKHRPTPWTTFAALKTLPDDALKDDFIVQQDIRIDDAGDENAPGRGMEQFGQEDEAKAREVEEDQVDVEIEDIGKESDNKFLLSPSRHVDVGDP